MATRLTDTRRTISVAEADTLFADLAVTEAALIKAAADTDKKIADLKAAHEAKTADLKLRHAKVKADLTAYILNNKDRFDAPRQRKTNFGSYGLRTASKTNIDIALLVDYANANGRPELYECAFKPNAKAVGKLLKTGICIPGAEITTGDIASYSVDLILLSNTDTVLTNIVE